MFQYACIQVQSQKYIVVISLGKGEWYASSIFYNDPLLRHQTAMCHVVIWSEQTFRDIYFVFLFVSCHHWISHALVKGK